MIIVSQDKEKIFVLENLSKIGIDEDNAIRPFNLGDKWNELGKYKTKERAKEVLKEIIEQYEYIQRLQENRGYSLSSGNNYVYEMPKE